MAYENFVLAKNLVPQPDRHRLNGLDCMAQENAKITPENEAMVQAAFDQFQSACRLFGVPDEFQLTMWKLAYVAGTMNGMATTGELALKVFSK